MVAQFIELIRTSFVRFRLILWVLPIATLCTISILIVIVSYVARRIGPAAVLVSNVSPTSTAVSFTSVKPEPTCGVLYGLGWPFFTGTCEPHVPASVHRLIFHGLAPGTTYHLILGSGLKWWNAGAVDVSSLGDSGNGISVFFPLILTKSKGYVIDQKNSLTIVGHVVDDQGSAQSSALVVATKSGSDTVWSTRANVQGNFSLTIPDVSIVSNISISVWSDHGFTALTDQALNLIRDAVTITVQKYEK